MRQVVGGVSLEKQKEVDNMPDEITPCIGLAGRSGFGKTYKAKQILGACSRSIVYDMVSDDGKPGNPEHGYEGMSYQIINGPLLPGSTILAEAMRRPAFHICYRPADINAELPYFCELLKWAGANAPLTVFFDECYYLTENVIPMPIRELIRMRRHLGITLMFAAQRPQKFGRDLFNALTALYVFQVTGRNDIEYLEKNGPGFELKQLADLRVNQYVKLDL